MHQQTDRSTLLTPRIGVWVVEIGEGLVFVCGIVQCTFSRYIVSAVNHGLAPIDMTFSSATCTRRPDGVRPLQADHICSSCGVLSEGYNNS